MLSQCKSLSLVVALSASCCVAAAQEAPVSEAPAQEIVAQDAPVLAKRVGRVSMAGTSVSRKTSSGGRAIVSIRPNPASPAGRLVGVTPQPAPKNWLGYRYPRVYGSFVTPVRPPYYTANGSRIYRSYRAGVNSPYQASTIVGGRYGYSPAYGYGYSRYGYSRYGYSRSYGYGRSYGYSSYGHGHGLSCTTSGRSFSGRSSRSYCRY